jgi:hypothetical protein
MIGSSVDPNSYAIVHFRGDDQDYDFYVTGPPVPPAIVGPALDITGWSFFFTVKSDIEDDISAAKFQKVLTAGISIVDGPSGHGLLSIAAADVAALEGPFIYDLKAWDAAGKHHTLRRENFTVPKNVTTDGTSGQASAAGSQFPNWIFIGGALYLPDTVNPTQFWKITVINGVFDFGGPNATIPF